MGAHAPWLKRVKSLASTMPWTTSVLVDITDMAKVMTASDLAIGAAGSTSWERCCLGLPSITIVLAENQKLIAEALQKEGAAINIDNVSNRNFEMNFKRAINIMLNDQIALQRMIAAASTIVDGDGTARVTHFLTDFQL